MVYSMTGFGRGTSLNTDYNFVIEIKSVNHRFLDINIKMPRNLSTIEDKIRNMVNNKIKRGKVDIYITQKNFEKDKVQAVLNHGLAQSYLNCLKEIKETYNLRDDITASNVARFPEVICLDQKEQDMEMLWPHIENSLNEALDMILNMRRTEGEKLYKDIIKKCEAIEELLTKVEKRAPLVVIEYKGKLRERLKELLEDPKNYDENRVAMEVAIFADKSSIDEEITRLKSHIEQMRSNLELKEPIGRKLDFIVQEMNRETNTIGSKANDLSILNYVLEMKSEIEKIREQIQNIE